MLHLRTGRSCCCCSCWLSNLRKLQSILQVKGYMYERASNTNLSSSSQQVAQGNKYCTIMLLRPLSLLQPLVTQWYDVTGMTLGMLNTIMVTKKINKAKSCCAINESQSQCKLINLCFWASFSTGNVHMYISALFS